MNLSSRFKPLISAGVAVAACLAITGCGDSDAELAESYNLEATAGQRGPSASVAGIVANLEADLNGREVDPQSAVAGAQENIASYTAEQFGDQAATFEQLKAKLDEMGQTGSRAELQKKVGELKALAEKLKGTGSGAAAE